MTAGMRVRLGARRFVRSTLGVPRLAERSLGWDVIAGLCVGIFLGALIPFLTRIAKDLHAPDAALAVMNAAPFVGNLLAPLWARQMDGKAKLPFCTVSWIAARAGLLFLPLLVFLPKGASAWAFTLTISWMMFVGTIASPAYAALMKDIYPDRLRGRLMGYVRVAMQSTTFVATLIAGRLMDHGVSFRVVFPIAGLFGILAAVFFARVRPLAVSESTTHRATDTKALAFLPATVAILRHNAGYRWFALSVMTYGFGNLMAWPCYQLFQVEVLHIRATEIANLTNVTSLCAIGGSFLWGRFIDRHGAPKTVLCSIVFVASISAVYLLAHSIPALYAASVLAGFGMSGIELSYMASILTYAEAGRAAQYQSLHSLLLGLRGVLAPLVAFPLLRHYGFTALFSVTLVLMIFGAIVQGIATRLANRPA